MFCKMIINVEVADHQGRRPYMEDTHCVEIDFFDDWSLFAVFDGHGGDYVSKFLKFHFKDILRSCMMESSDLIVAIKNAFSRITHQLDLERSISCGSTVCAVLIKGNKIIAINTGDSRAVFGTNNITKALTEDHKPALMREEVRIREKGGFITRMPNDAPRVNGVLATSRSVGDLALFPHVIADPDITYVEITNMISYLAIATDGLWDVYTGDDVITMLKQNMHSAEIVSSAIARGSMDNITIISLTFNNKAT